MAKNLPGSIPSETLGLLGDIFGKTAKGVYTHQELEDFSKRINPFPQEGSRKMRGRKAKIDDVIGSKLDLWQKYYRDSHKLDLDLGGIRIPDKQDGFERLIVVARGLTLNRLVEVARKKYQMWLYRDDLDRAIVHSDRNSTETYAIWVRDRQEADEEMANQSAEDVWFKKLTGVTLLERLVHDDEEFTRTGRHLDEDNVTLCLGSRGSDGDVPDVDWFRDDREVGVDWYGPQERGPGLRCRLAVA